VRLGYFLTGMRYELCEPRGFEAFLKFNHHITPGRSGSSQDHHNLRNISGYSQGDHILANLEGISWLAASLRLRTS
jgi:hypothetical protein